MAERKPRNAALEFAKAFTYLVAQEACRMGKRRTLDARKFEKWARAIIRRTGGDPDQIGEIVGKRLHWLVYDQRAKWKGEIDYCIKRARAMAWRHKVIIAEQVLTDGVMPLTSEDWAHLKQAAVEELLAQQISLYDGVLRIIREKKGKDAIRAVQRPS